MSNEIILKECKKCGALVRVLKDCNCEDCGIRCCEEEMQTIIPNTFDAAMEKHIPEYKVVDNKIHITVNHGMDTEHYIEYITYVTDKFEFTARLSETAEAIFDYQGEGKIYAYCNKHSMWMTHVK